MNTTVQRLVFVFALTAATLSAPALQRDWVAKGPSAAVWSGPDNWSPAGVPQDGDELRFAFEEFPIPSTTAMVNDLTNLTVSALQFVSGAWQLSGTPLGITTAIGMSGDGNVNIQCAFRLEGNASFVSYPELDEESADFSFTGNVDLNGHVLRLVSRRDCTVDLAGAISGSGQIRIDVVTIGWFHPGTVKFSGTADNTFTGSVTMTSESHFFFGTVQGANLVLDKQSAIAVPGSLIMGTNCDVKLNRPHQIADDAPVTLGPGATFLLQGNAETVGNLSLAGSWTGGTLGKAVVDTGGATLSVQGNIAANNLYADDIPRIQGKLGLPPGHHAISVSGNQFHGLNIEAQIVGDGGFTKTGTAGLILTGNNTLNGEVTVQQGVLEIRHARALGSVAGFTVLTSQGVLVLNNTAIFGESLFARGNVVLGPDAVGAWVEGIGTNVWSGPVILETNLLVTGFNGGSVNLNGLISGPGGLRCLSGTVELSGTDANTFTGSTVVQNPLLLLNKTAGVAAFGGPLLVGAGAGLFNEVRWLKDYQRVFADVTLLSHGYVNLNGHRDDFGPVTFHGGYISTGAAGELGLYGLLTVNAQNDVATLDGHLGLPPGLHEFRIHDGGAFPDLQVNATVIGAGNLRKTGAGQMWLSSANTYEGLTTVAEGALSVLHANGLGGATTGTTVQEGATLELNFAGTMPESVALRGTGTYGQGALDVFGNVTLRPTLPSIFAAIDLTTNTTIGVTADRQLTVDGTISGVGDLTKVGPGTLWFAGTDHNTYRGETYINEGRFIMGKPSGATAVPGSLSISSAAGLGALAGNVASYQIIGNIFVNRNGLYNINGQVENVDHLWLTEGGDVQTSTGVLFLKSGGSIQVVPGTVGALSTITGNLDMAAGDHVINVGAGSGSDLASAVQLEIGALITSSLGSVNLHKDGAGILRLTGNNTYSGPTVIKAGVVQLDGIQSGSSFQIQNGGELAGQGRVGSINFLSSGVGSRSVAPGNAPGLGAGILRCSTFNSAGAGGALKVDLRGPSPGAGGYDQLHAMSRFATVRLDGVTLDARLQFAAAVNDQFTIILNDGTLSFNDDTPKPVIGQFTGLPEGASLYLGGEPFTISYVGGDGNDVVLHRVPTPPRPLLTIEQLAPDSLRLLWPASFTNYTLQFTTNLSGTAWAPAMPLPVVLGTNNAVTIVTVGRGQFYRLVSP